MKGVIINLTVKIKRDNFSLNFFPQLVITFKRKKLCSDRSIKVPSLTQSDT